MARTSPEDVERKHIAAISRHDFATAAAMLDPNFKGYDPLLPEPIKGREAWRKVAEALHKPFPDIKYGILNIVAKDDVVAIEGTLAGTFKGPFEFAGRVISPTGRRVELRYAQFSRVNSKGLIAERHEYFDPRSLFRQLGAEEGATA
jgi:predicted ester cyclase